MKMSGGYFDYAQFRIGDIEKIIEEELYKLENDASDDEFDCDYGFLEDQYRDDVIKRFEEAIVTLKRARIYAHRIDWFLSGDDGPESFLKKLERELEELENDNTK